jgi:hypothetical protein
MMKILFRSIILIIFAISLKSCEPVEGTDCPVSKRTGAICNDGTSSTATGSGACSHHGGVDYWLCN